MKDRFLGGVFAGILVLVFGFISIQPLEAFPVSIGATNYNNISAALDAAVSGDIISLGATNFTGLENVNLNIGNKNISFIGADQSLTIIDCQMLGRAFYVANQSPTEPQLLFFQNITFTNCVSNIDESLPGLPGAFSRNGGALLIYHKQMQAQITDCTFISNSARIFSGDTLNREPSGGALFFSGVNSDDIETGLSNLNVSNCQFTSNRAINTGDNFGGAVFVEFSVSNWDNVVFETNTGLFGGAAVFSVGETVIQNSIFRGNQADNGGGAIYVNAGSVQTNQVIFEDNTARVEGGAIYSRRTISCTETTFLRNEAETGGGGAIRSEFSSCTVRRSNFTDNIGNNRGGAIGLSDSSFTIEDSFMENNQAGDGGGMSFDGRQTGVIRNTVVEGNQAQRGGGLYSQSGMRLDLISSRVTNNVASIEGGGYYCGATVLTVQDSVISDNTAQNSPQLHCSTTIPSSFCDIRGNSAFTGFCAEPKQEKDSTSDVEIAVIVAASVIGVGFLGFTLMFIIYFCDESHRISQGFVWTVVKDEEDI